MSSFNQNIPLVTDKILKSQKQLKANFQAINNSYSVNHIAYNQDLLLSGMHSLLTLRPQTGDPVTSATQIALYNKKVLYGAQNLPNLFYAPSSSQSPIQMTYPSIKADESNTQYTFMAGPFIIYGGLIKGPISQGQLVTLTPGTTLLHVDLTMTNSIVPGAPSMAIPTNITGTSFNISFAASGVSSFDAFYFAIGL